MDRFARLKEVIAAAKEFRLSDDESMLADNAFNKVIMELKRPRFYAYEGLMHKAKQPDPPPDPAP